MTTGRQKSINYVTLSTRNVAFDPELQYVNIAYVPVLLLKYDWKSHVKWASNIEFISVEYMCVNHSGSNIFMTE